MNTEFIKYIPVHGQSYDGIVVFSRNGKDILRYKWVPKKDGKGHFLASSSIKLVNEDGEKYLPSHEIDSKIEWEEIDTILREGIRQALQVKGIRPVQMEQSTFASSPSYEPKQADDCPF